MQSERHVAEYEHEQQGFHTVAEGSSHLQESINECFVIDNGYGGKFTFFMVYYINLTS